MGVTLDLTLGTGSIESALKRDYTQPIAHDALIDVFENERTIRLVVELPGVKKEDVEFEVGDNVIDLHVKKDGTIYHKQIQCGYTSRNIEVRSITENNSVLEITLNKSTSSNNYY